MRELLPCPFCGGEADVKVLEYDDDCKVWGVFCESDLANEYSHGHFVDNYATEAEAIEAWNTRAERTCECVAEYAKSPIDGKTIVLHRCSACHELMRPHMAYCPNCGARVTKSDQDS